MKRAEPIKPTASMLILSSLFALVIPSGFAQAYCDWEEDDGEATAGLDQDNLYGTCCTIEIKHPDVFQQSVTAGIEGVLAGIVIEMHERFGTGAVTFSLYEGLATPESSPVFSETIDTTWVSAVPPAERPDQFLWDVLSSYPLWLKPGDVFTFGLQGLNVGDGAEFANDIGDQYHHGALFINGVNSSHDLAFRTYMNPMGAVDIVELLISLVNESDFRRTRPLLATLESALASIERGTLIAAINQLHAFQNKVRAQVQPADPDLAAQLTEAAAAAIEALESEIGSDTLALRSRTTRPKG